MAMMGWLYTFQARADPFASHRAGWLRMHRAPVARALHGIETTGVNNSRTTVF